MKTKIFKTGLPIMAFLMAIAFAFASELKPVEEDVPVIGYILQNGMCKQVVEDCDPTGTSLCTYGTTGLYVHNFKDSDTSCRTIYRDWP